MRGGQGKGDGNDWSILDKPLPTDQADRCKRPSNYGPWLYAEPVDDSLSKSNPGKPSSDPTEP